jgi:hypothetical protein
MNADDTCKTVEAINTAIGALKTADRIARQTCDHTHADGTLAIVSAYPGTSFEFVPRCTACNFNGHDHPELFKGIEYVSSEQRRRDPFRVYADPGTFIKGATC